MKNRQKYPPNWPALARACKELAGWHCQKCGIAHGVKRFSPWTEREWPVYLQAAHVHHDPDNLAPSLVCVCPSCHWNHFRRPGQHLTDGVIEARKHRILLERRGYHGPWRPAAKKVPRKRG